MAQNYEYQNIPQDEELNFMNPTGVVDVYGRGGLLRHSGRFSAGNPYVEQMNLAVKNQDKDALFEKAVQWEADRANLLEQRAYDDPVAQIARQRAAGINPDIPSGSGGSGSGTSSGSSAVQPSTVGQTKMSNSYDNTSLFLQGFQTAASVVGSITSLGSGVVSALDTLKTLPSRSSILDTQAQIAKETMPTVIDSAKESLRSQKLQNIDASIGLLGHLSQFTTDKDTDEDVDVMLGSLGYSPDQIEPTRKALRHYQSNPALQSYYGKQRLAALEVQEQEKTYTPELFGRLVEIGARVKESSARFEEDQIALQSSLVRYLNQNNYGQKSGENMLEQVNLSQEQAAFSRQKLENDVTAYVNNLEDVKTAYLQCKTTIAKIYSDARAQGRFLSSAEQAVVDANQIQMQQLHSLGSHNLAAVYEIARKASSDRYMADVNFNSEGDVEFTPGIQKHSIFVGYTFGNFVKEDTSTNAVVSSIMSMIPLVGGVANDAYQFSQTKPTQWVR